MVGGKVVYGDGKYASLAPAAPKVAPDWLPISKYPGYSKSTSVESGEHFAAVALDAAMPTAIGADGTQWTIGCGCGGLESGIRLDPSKQSRRAETGAELYAPLPLSSIIVVVAIVAMMMTPIVVTRVICVGVVTTVVVRSPPAPAVVIADPTYLLHVHSTVSRDWCDRHCRRCGRC